ncbi:MAG: hypothetical protein AAGK04_12425 [Planctomycetota bacterium]
MRPRVGRVVVGLLAALAGCSGGAPREDGQGGLRPSVVGDRDGLEVRWWVVEERGQALASTLAAYADRPSPIGELRAESLRESGLRLVVVSREEAEAIHNALPTVGADVRQWLGELTLWTEVVKGPSLPASAIRTHLGSEAISAGRVRMLARCYRLPGGGGEGMRLELAPQLERRDRLDAELRIALGESAGLETAGRVFSSLAMSWSPPPGEVYLLVPEAPSVDWRSVSMQEREDSAASEAGDDGRPAWAGVGPAAPSTPTLGEALLGSVDQRPGLSGRRAIVVLAPTSRGRRELIPG